MRQELKIGLGFGVLAIVFAVGYLMSRAAPPVDGTADATSLASDEPSHDIDREVVDRTVPVDPAQPLPELERDEPASPSPVTLTDVTSPTDRPSLLDPPARDTTLSPAPRITVPSDDRTGLAGTAWTTDAGEQADRDEATDVTPDDVADITITVPDAEIEEMPVRPHLTPTDAPRWSTGTSAGSEDVATRPASEAATVDQQREAVPSVASVHEIQPGETFSALAVRYFGHAKHTDLISKANPSLDPHRLYVGAKVNIPPRPEERTAETTRQAPTAATADRTAPTPAADGSRTAETFTPPPVPEDRRYVVQAGEGWYDLARRFLGDGNRWPELLELNRDRVSRDPRMLKVGAVIEVPRVADSGR